MSMGDNDLELDGMWHRGVENGRELEREAIVEWLRARGRTCARLEGAANATWSRAFADIAAEVEHGEHLKPAEEGRDA